jgi:hypothetical protein
VRDFKVFTVSADAQERVRLDESMHRQGVAMQEEAYRRHDRQQHHAAVTAGGRALPRASNVGATSAFDGWSP